MQVEVFGDTDDAETGQTDRLHFFREVKWTKS